MTRNEFLRRAGFPPMARGQGWDCERADGAVLFFVNRVDVQYERGFKRAHAWLVGDAPSDASRGGMQRIALLQRLVGDTSVPAPLLAVFTEPKDNGARTEQMADVIPVLYTVRGFVQAGEKCFADIEFKERFD